jgi:hypothetical protein
MNAMNRTDKTTRRIIWVLAGIMVFSFAFGVVMFIPTEHRAQKLAEMALKYQARQHRVAPESHPTQR